MALKIYDTLAPQGDYPAVEAKDVKMPDGTKLSEVELGGGSITVDSALDHNSTNPVQNKVIAEMAVQFSTAMEQNVVPNLLPTASTANNGKIPKVVNGAWALADDATGGSSVTLDTTLSQAGQAADAGAVGAALTQATNNVGNALTALAQAIPTDEHINSLIDTYLSEALGGEY